MPPANPSVWIIIPTYNERDNVGPITDAVLGAVPDAHVLIVDDGSPDGTGELADEMAAKNPAIAVLHRQAKQGLGKAYVAAFKHLWPRRGHDRPDGRRLQPPRSIPAVAAGAAANRFRPTWSWVRATSRAATSRAGTSCGASSAAAAASSPVSCC
jgi:hypothetical protein